MTDKPDNTIGSETLSCKTKNQEYSKSLNHSHKTSQQPLSNKHRIARNTLMLYFRQILIMLVSLYTVRIVLETLGAEDYGIYNVVAGVVTMFGFLSGAMASASQRYFSYEIGCGNYEQLKKTFSVTLTIYVLLAALIVLFAQTAGLWFVYNKLVIPAERFTAAKWIYQSAILSFVITIMTTPYMSSIIAHENMNVYAYVSIIEAALKFALVFILRILPYDKLIVYGILLLFVSCITTVLYRIYCRRHYEECRFRLMWDKVMFGEITSYIGWNLFGAASGVVKNQGINILLNQYFGPVINAARAVASQVNAAVISFSQNFSTAMRPQIIKSYALHKKKETMSLVFRGCKITFFLMYIFALPLILEMPFILKLWLKNPPEMAILFTRIALIDAVIESLSYSVMTLAQATGKMKLYQSLVGGILLCNLPISYIVLRLGAPAWSVMLIAVFITLAAFIARLFIIKKLTEFSIFAFAKWVITPVLFISVLNSGISISIKKLLPDTVPSSFSVIFISVICTGICIFLFGLTKPERKKLIQVFKGKSRV